MLNAWVEAATRGYIRDIFEERDISAATRLVLASAVYFLGSWEEPFAPAETCTAPFWLDASTSVPTAMMSQECGYARYASGDGWEVGLNDVLGQLGMVRAFRPSEADFSGAVCGEPTWLGLVQAPVPSPRR